VSTPSTLPGRELMLYCINPMVEFSGLDATVYRQYRPTTCRGGLGHEGRGESFRCDVVSSELARRGVAR